MSQDQLVALIARLARDPDFASALEAALTVADAQRIAAAYGFDVTADECASATADSELSDAQLEGVAGGTCGTMNDGMTQCI